MQEDYRAARLNDIEDKSLLLPILLKYSLIRRREHAPNQVYARNCKRDIHVYRNPSSALLFVFPFSCPANFSSLFAPLTWQLTISVV
jgi:hypothetical protein